MLMVRLLGLSRILLLLLLFPEVRHGRLEVLTWVRCCAVLFCAMLLLRAMRMDCACCIICRMDGDGRKNKVVACWGSSVASFSSRPTDTAHDIHIYGRPCSTRPRRNATAVRYRTGQGRTGQDR